MNASENPFATGRVERLLSFDPKLIGSSWDAVERRWSELKYYACVRGPHGSGKTTFLEAMSKRLEREGTVEQLFFNDRKTSLSSNDRAALEAAAGRFLMVDGDEYLSSRERRELVRKAKLARGCLFARHRRGGLPELLRLQPDVEMASVLLGRISSKWHRKLEPCLDRRLAGHGGNLRELWLECFDLAATEED